MSILSSSSPSFIYSGASGVKGKSGFPGVGGYQTRKQDFLTRFDLMDMTNEDGVIIRSKCMKFFKQKRINASVSKFIKRFNEKFQKAIVDYTDYNSSPYSTFTYRNIDFRKLDYNSIIIELRREWEINKVLK
tara:strand:- start:15868 stop:16263 length:396 start_codon:yes stop_codon:yes gene_type:complete